MFGGDAPEDPWMQVIEIPLRHKETGDSLHLHRAVQTSLAAAKDLLAQCRRLPEAFEPVVRLSIGSFKGRFGVVKKPLLSVVGKVPIDGALRGPSARGRDPVLGTTSSASTLSWPTSAAAGVH